jgi:pyruvate,water dikinase
VVVQGMVPAASSGVAFTADPVSGDRSRIVIEAAFGQGEVVVGGRVEPDTYIVDKDRLEVIDERIGVKLHKIVPGDDGDLRVELDADEANARVLSTEKILDIARMVTRVEAHYGAPQDVEWCVDPDGGIHLVQTRPITTLTDTAPAPPVPPACCTTRARDGRSSTARSWSLR